MKKKLLDLKLVKNFFLGKKVLITGHTGFKGVWLTKILQDFSPKLFGISYDDNYFTNDKLYKKIKKFLAIKNISLDIKNIYKIQKELYLIQPEIIFHFAAQSLVLDSIKNPENTILTNAIGTYNLLESIKNLKSVKYVFIVTTDKVYPSRDYKSKETDLLGGADPYSLSKVIADHISQYYKYFIFSKNVKFFIIRSGNVYGGGDFASNRLVPDYFRFNKVVVRNPNSIRPFQFILDVLFCYISIITQKKSADVIWNVGPSRGHKVIDIIKNLRFIKKKNFYIKNNKKNIENKILKLNVDKVKNKLLWKNKLNIKTGLKLSSEIYLNFNKSGGIINKIINNQIFFYKKKFMN
jgi:CDP-glucose 4,6-dehydratase